VIDLATLADGLTRDDAAGLWRTGGDGEAVSYPEGDSDLCFGVEERSFWFAHRNRAIAAAVARFPPQGLIADIGGGNGFVARSLEGAGHEVVLVEPSPSGARHAVSRGLRHVVQGTLAAARFHRGVLGGAGLFDVVEHIEDDVAFLRALRPLLAAGAPVYLTVPAWQSLWSADDVSAGHFRRYRRRTLTAALNAAGFEVVYSTYFFLPLPPAIALFRALPSRLGLGRAVDERSIGRQHAGAGLLAPLFNGELRLMRRGHALPFGASILAVARGILNG
jgi:hypothetical protein